MRCSECGVSEAPGGDEVGRHNLCEICYDDYCNGMLGYDETETEEEDAYCEWLEDEVDCDYSITS